MPWCDQCARFYNPNTLRPDGTCPMHHRVAEPAVADPAVGETAAAEPVGETAAAEPVGEAPGAVTPDAAEGTKTSLPWHFWLLIIALGIYLGWRLVQLIVWLVT